MSDAADSREQSDSTGEGERDERDSTRRKLGVEPDAPGPIRAGLTDLRADGWARWGSTLAGLVIGGVAAWLHPVGLVVGAALVALPRSTIPRGVAAGLAFGLLAVAANLGVVWLGDGTAGVTTALALRQVTGVSVAIGLAGGLVGGLVRGVV